MTAALLHRSTTSCGYCHLGSLPKSVKYVHASGCQGCQPKYNLTQLNQMSTLKKEDVPFSNPNTNRNVHTHTRHRHSHSHTRRHAHTHTTTMLSNSQIGVTSTGSCDACSRVEVRTGDRNVNMSYYWNRDIASSLQILENTLTTTTKLVQCPPLFYSIVL